MDKLLCIYHANCADGFGAAYAVWKRYGDSAEYVQSQYGDAPPDVKGRHVAIVDFSYKLHVLEKIMEEAKSVVLLDHHKTAHEDLTALVQRGNGIVFDMNKSGAVLTWEHFHPNQPLPELLRYIQDRDLWKKELPGTEEFTVALRSYPFDFEVWDGLHVDQLIDEGRHILRYHQQLSEEVENRVMQLEIGGYTVPVVNAPPALASDVAGLFAQNAPFAACYWIGPRGISYSLRSRNDGIDVSEIAKKYGGGGHRNSAGFVLPSWPEDGMLRIEKNDRLDIE